MPQTFKIKNSVEADKVPAAGDLATAELALNLKDQKLYSKDADGNVFEIGVCDWDDIKDNPITIDDNQPGSPSEGDLWVDLNECPPQLKIWNDCEDPGNPDWISIGGAAGKPGVITTQPTLTADNSNYAPCTLTATEAEAMFATKVDEEWYLNGSEIVVSDVGAVSTYMATEPGTYKYEEKWVGDDGNILLASAEIVIEKLEIKKPEVLTPPDGAGIGGDVTYTPKTSAITGKTETLPFQKSTDWTANTTTNSLTGDPALLFDGTTDTSIESSSPPLVQVTFDSNNNFDTVPHRLRIMTVGDREISIDEGANYQRNNESTAKRWFDFGLVTFSSIICRDWTGTWPGIIYAIEIDGIILKNVGLTDASDNNTALTLTDANTYNNDGGADMSTAISETFKAGDKVVGEGDATVFANTAAFSTTLYSNPSGTGEITIETGVGNTVKSLIWFKNRDNNVANHKLYDTLRGPEQLLESNATDGNQNNPNSLIEFLSNGVKVGSGSGLNSSENMVAWNFRGAPGFFDVVSYVGNADAAHVIPHSLKTAPGFIITKDLDNGTAWLCYHKELPATEVLILNANGQPSVEPFVYPAEPTANDFTVGTSASINNENNKYISYLFADTPGLVKCDSYDGNDTSQTITTGFKVGWLLIKNTTTNGHNWVILDQKRDVGTLFPNTNDKENTFYGANYISLDDSDGFNLNQDHLVFNRSGNKYIYVAIAEDASAGQFMPTGVLTEDAAGTSMTLSDVTGEWKAGLTVVNETEATETAPGADDIVFTSTKPVATSGTVNTWGQAEWQLSVDSGFADKQEASVSLADTNPEQGPTGFTLEGDTEYWVRTRYNSTSPTGSPSEWSEANKFKTAGVTGGAFGNFSTTLYTGNNSTQSVETGVDNTDKSLVWLKKRDFVNQHWLYDTIRGPGVALFSNLTNGESAEPTGLTAFNSDGFTLGTSGNNNGTNESMVAWNFAAAPGFFDVVTYEAGDTEVPHDLGVAPGMIIYKSTDTSGNWVVMHKEATKDANQWWESIGNLNEPNAWMAQNNYATAEPDSQKFYPAAYLNSADFVAYLFADNPEGGIKCGSYTLVNNPENKTLIECGFKPGWLLIKKADNDGDIGVGKSDWVIVDRERQGAKDKYDQLYPDLNVKEAEYGNVAALFTNTGFKLEHGAPLYGSLGVKYIYVAIADSTVRFYDESTASTVTNHTLTKRYGVDPLTTDLRKFGIYPLTEQPTYSVDTFVKEGQAYNPVRNYTSELNRAQRDAAEANARLDDRDKQIRSLKIEVAKAAALEKITTAMEERLAALEAKDEGDGKATRKKR